MSLLVGACDHSRRKFTAFPPYSTKFNKNDMVQIFSRYRIDGVKFSQWTCVRQDGVDLVKEWEKDHKAAGRKATFVDTTGKLQSVNYNDIDRLLGIFSISHLPYDHERDTGDDGQPRFVKNTL